MKLIILGKAAILVPNLVIRVQVGFKLQYIPHYLYPCPVCAHLFYNIHYLQNLDGISKNTYCFMHVFM